VGDIKILVFFCHWKFKNIKKLVLEAKISWATSSHLGQCTGKRPVRKKNNYLSWNLEPALDGPTYIIA